MADPTKYERDYSFTDYQASNPSAPLPGLQVDNELEGVETSLGEAIDAIKDVRRSDGALKNGIVTVDSLSPTVAAGVGAGALASAEAAAASADAASDSAVAAAASASAAGISETAASGYASNALTSRNEASGFSDDSAAAATLAQTARDFANLWATEASDVEVDDGVNDPGKSAYHWAQVALAAAAGSIADGSVTTPKLVDGVLSADTTGRAKMADGFVTSAKIADGTIATADLADGAVTSAKIADGTIATGDLATGSVTAAKAGTDFVSGQTAKTTPVDADTVLIADSAASDVPKKLTFANLWIWVKAKIIGEVSLIRLQTFQPTTSGNATGRTDIPPWAKRVTINLMGFGANGINLPKIRIGSGAYDTTGYSGSVSNISGSTLHTTGFDIANQWSAASRAHGKIVLDLADAATNTWTVNGVLGFSNGAGVTLLGGSKALSGPLDRVQIVSNDTHSAGGISVSWE